jgi:endo-1,4-beta-xylanase
MELDRRQLLAGGAAAFASAAVAAPAPPDSLDSFAKRSDRRFGSAVAWGKPGADRGSFANPA